MFKKDKAGIDYFEIGTISIFIGLLFVTIIPVFLTSFLIISSPIWDRIIAGIFFLFTLIFYVLSLDYYKEQLIIIFFNLALFFVFQYLINVL